MEFMESIKKPVVEEVRFIQADGSNSEGMLCLTAFYCIFSTRTTAAGEITVSPFPSSLHDNTKSFNCLQFLYTAVMNMERKSPTPSVVLEIVLKDFRHFSLAFKTPEDCNDVADSLEQLSRPS